MKRFALCFLKSFELNVLAEIINWWEDWRCASNAESVFNLEDKEVFKIFVDKYGSQKAVACFNECQYWLDGMNFTEPLKMDRQKMTDFIGNEYDIELFKDMLDCGYEETLSKWFHIKGIKNLVYNYKPYTLTCTFKSDLDANELFIKFENFLYGNVDDYHITIKAN